MSPQKPRGDEAQGLVKVQVAIHMLEDSINKVGAHTKVGKAVLKALQLLVKETGQDEERPKSMLPAELKAGLMDNPSAPPDAGGAPPPPGAGGGLSAGGPPGGPPG